MAYQALYRKYRPKDFSDVKGQEAIVTTLTNQLKSGRIGHAYMFCGTRGTGKTTVAKILAKALNCENPGDFGPCGECAHCQSIEDGSSMNVIEIDGASNNGVADVRQIVDEVNYPPMDGGRKVYIIDEVHMLSESAFNALLKTLEEPPSYLTFILATTDPQKVIPTIQSRCQRYDFKRISVETIVARLHELLTSENVEVEDRALNYIARVADGALRDALSLTEECISYYFGEKLTFDKVLAVVGGVDNRVYHDMTEALISGDTATVIAKTDELVASGRDLLQYAKEYIWYLRNLLIIKTAGDGRTVSAAGGSDQTAGGQEMGSGQETGAGQIPETGQAPENSRPEIDVRLLIDMSDENIDILKRFSGQLEQEQIVRYIHVMSRLVADMRHTANRRVEFEIALIRLCKPQMERDYDSLIDRMKNMERDLGRMQDMLEAGAFVPAGTGQAGAAGAGQAGTGAGAASAAPPKPVRPEAVPDDVKEVVSGWKHIMQAVQAAGEGRMYAALDKVILSVDDGGSLEIGFQNKLDYDMFSKEKTDKLTDIIGEAIGKHVNIVAKDASNAAARVGVVDLRDIIPNADVPIIVE